MSIDLIAKVAPKNNGFIGMVDSNQVIYTIVPKTDTYTATVNDHVIICNKGTAMTINLLTAVGNSGLMIRIKSIGAGVVTVDGNASETIDGETTQTVNQYDLLEIVSDGANWVII